MSMISRYNRKWTEPIEKSEPIKEDYELITIIEPVSFNEDKTIKEYKEVQKYVVHKSKWIDFIKSYDIGSPSEQVMNHLSKGTPLITSYTLPAGDYRKATILKGAEIVREMKQKGITLEMIEAALSQTTDNSSSTETVTEGGAN